MFPLYPGGDGDPPTEAVVTAFMAVATQWRLAPMGGIVGLDYVGADIALKRLGIDAPAPIWEGLQIMERAVISELRRRHGR